MIQILTVGASWVAPVDDPASPTPVTEVTLRVTERCAIHLLHLEAVTSIRKGGQELTLAAEKHLVGDPAKDVELEGDLSKVVVTTEAI